jgi:hypothetical protein
MRASTPRFLAADSAYVSPFCRLQTCDSILERFEKVAFPLAQEYGALPVIGIGHSCGALLQVL